jgi:hypothetical protein
MLRAKFLMIWFYLIPLGKHGASSKQHFGENVVCEFSSFRAGKSKINKADIVVSDVDLASSVHVNILYYVHKIFICRR